ncbi:hypothetical protein [Fundidesulfovibrio terrae]|uniref:hypothetical protein n=1 Tax=Fundidesulfovibrio terrae TaxID=2922866 RepID=UPI001FB04505|nr:hypothetical protein [Fundidesulfovibrio terrae]
MSESVHHRKLVKELGSDVTYDAGWSRQPIVYVDLQDGLAGEHPRHIGANRPDIYARDISTGRTVIGEAKTTNDIDNQHTCVQLASYFEYLSLQTEGELWIGVPWMSAGTAIRISKLVRRQTRSYNIPICVVGYMICTMTVRKFWRE